MSERGFFSASNDIKTLDRNIFSGFPWLTTQLNAKFIVIHKPLTLNDRDNIKTQFSTEIAKSTAS